jgi:hypothetical protein
MVIPDQIELARDKVNLARADKDAKRKEVERWVNAIQQGRTRLAKLEEERDQLAKEVTGEKPAPARTEGKP